jgi:hypothetical protein
MDRSRLVRKDARDLAERRWRGPFRPAAPGGLVSLSGEDANERDREGRPGTTGEYVPRVVKPQVATADPQPRGPGGARACGARLIATLVAMDI